MSAVALKIVVPLPLRIKAEQRQIVPPVVSQKPAAELAEKLGNIPVRTVENWQQGRAVPDAAHWEALKVIFPEFEAKSREWRAIALGVEPLDEGRLLSKIEELIVRHVNRGDRR